MEVSAGGAQFLRQRLGQMVLPEETVDELATPLGRSHKGFGAGFGVAVVGGEGVGRQVGPVVGHAHGGRGADALLQPEKTVRCQTAVVHLKCMGMHLGVPVGLRYDDQMGTFRVFVEPEPQGSDAEDQQARRTAVQ